MTPLGGQIPNKQEYIKWLDRDGGNEQQRWVEEIIDIQLNFVKANFIETNNSLRRSESSVPN